MNIENVIKNEDLEIRFKNVCKNNWKVSNIGDTVIGKTVKEKIDNWPKPTKQALLDLMSVNISKV